MRVNEHPEFRQLVNTRSGQGINTPIRPLEGLIKRK